MEQNRRSAHEVLIADHLWEAFSRMSQGMGVDRDALINQAMFMFARVNGFVDQARPLAAVPGAGERHVGPAPTPAVPLSLAAAGDQRRAESPSMDGALRSAAELANMVRSRDGDPSLTPPKSPAPPLYDINLPPPRSSRDPQTSAPERRTAQAPKASLYLMLEDGSLNKIEVDRYTIGRGKHCDLVINSGKVSREHALIFKEAGEYFIEDKGSSNGTWFNKQRITRRKIDDGDEYFICSEKVKVLIR